MNANQTERSFSGSNGSIQFKLSYYLLLLIRTAFDSVYMVLMILLQLYHINGFGKNLIRFEPCEERSILYSCDNIDIDVFDICGYLSFIFACSGFMQLLTIWPLSTILFVKISSKRLNVWLVLDLYTIQIIK